MCGSTLIKTISLKKSQHTENRRQQKLNRDNHINRDFHIYIMKGKRNAAFNLEQVQCISNVFTDISFRVHH